MKKSFLFLFAFALLLPFCAATLSGESNSVSCQANEVEVSPDGGSSSILVEDIFQIEEDRYWDVWCYVQDSQNFPVSNAVVRLEIDGQVVDEASTVAGWIKFPVIRSMPATAAFYSTTTPGSGAHELGALTGSLSYTAPFTVGQATPPFDIVTIAIVVVAGIAVFLAYLILRK